MNAISPRIKETNIANKKEDIKFPLIILVLYLFGFINPRNKPELNLEANDPLIFPLISKNPGSKIRIPGIRSNLSVYTTINVPAIKPPAIEISCEENISLKFLSNIFTYNY